MSKQVVLISGSPSHPSRSGTVLDWFGRALREAGWQVETFTLDDFEPAALVRAQAEDPAVTRVRRAVDSAAGVVLSTPVYKATYAGALKLIVDLFDPKALQGKALLGIGTARIPEHLSEVEVSFQRLAQFFQGSVHVPGLGLLDADLGASPNYALTQTGRVAFEAALARYLEALP
ncbi:MAG TPA: NAD(P)H-dependent oxidoreductase [Polyangiaceae bacterium]|nr:NAD(P)H-dependent oxidoreductase [Polyangiaceae bacterium]